MDAVTKKGLKEIALSLCSLLTTLSSKVQLRVEAKVDLRTSHSQGDVFSQAQYCSSGLQGSAPVVADGPPSLLFHSLGLFTAATCFLSGSSLFLLLKASCSHSLGWRRREVHGLFSLRDLCVRCPGRLLVIAPYGSTDRIGKLNSSLPSAQAHCAAAGWGKTNLSASLLKQQGWMASSRGFLFVFHL